VSGSRQQRLVHLEAFRGLAAMVVVVHHFLLAFTPITSGYLSQYRDQTSLAGGAHFAFVNGRAAVVFFFVMSGFVLTQRYLQLGHDRLLYVAFLKRWPRLFMPVFVSCVIASLLWKLDAYYFFEAGQRSNSSWLSTLGFGNAPKGNELGLVKASTESLSVFFNGVSHFNSVLWTMQPELAGSFLVMALAFVFRGLLQLRHMFYSCTLVFLACAGMNPYFYPFLFGLFVAVCRAKYPAVNFSKLMAWTLCAMGLYLLGYLEPVGHYAWVRSSASDNPQFRDQLYALGGTCVLTALVFGPKAYSYCCGKAGKLLGEMSFPIYLLHTLVIGSMSSWLYLRFFANGGELALWELFGVTCLVLFIAAFCLAKVDTYWVNWLANRFP
jgi:peptidoglycan/LPS O-acetylase OafA/YrhL